VNLITPAKRKSALASVKEGFSVSMARKAQTEPALDKPAADHTCHGWRGSWGKSRSHAFGYQRRVRYTDRLLPRLRAHAHGHVLPSRLQGAHVQGMTMTSVTEKACTMGSIYAWKDGIITHAVLMDIPRLKGVDYLEPGTRIYSEDLDADEDLSRPEHISAHSSSPS